jgi:hypothetical protein
LPIVTNNPESIVMPIFRNPDWTTIEGTDRPWLYTCGLAGPLKLRVQIAPKGSLTRRYRVTLYFCEVRDGAGRGTFDVILQGEKKLAGLDVARQAGGRKRPLTTQFTVEVTETLSLELVAQSGTPPIINALQIHELP